MECTTGAPFCIGPMAEPYSALLGLLAGFALTGIILLIEEIRENRPESKTYQTVAYLFFITFFTGTLSSYMYASLAGDPEILNIFTYIFPSTIFALNAQVLLAAICILIISMFELVDLRNLARWTTYLVVVLTVERMIRTVDAAYSYFWKTPRINLILWPLFAIPLIGLLFRVCYDYDRLLPDRLKKKIEYFQSASLKFYGFGVVITSFVISLIETAWFKYVKIDPKITNPTAGSIGTYLPANADIVYAWIAILCIAIIAILGTWVVFLLPNEKK